MTCRIFWKAGWRWARPCREILIFAILGLTVWPLALPAQSVPATVQTNADIHFALLISGNGSLAPNRHGMAFQTGKKYTVIATAAKGSVFANWVSNGIVVAVTRKYTFLVESNVVLQANFIPNPFTPAVGTYHGLLYPTNNAAEESSGSRSEERRVGK